MSVFRTEEELEEYASWEEGSGHECPGVGVDQVWVGFLPGLFPELLMRVNVRWPPSFQVLLYGVVAIRSSGVSSTALRVSAQL